MKFDRKKRQRMIQSLLCRPCTYLRRGRLLFHNNNNNHQKEDDVDVVVVVDVINHTIDTTRTKPSFLSSPSSLSEYDDLQYLSCSSNNNNNNNNMPTRWIGEVVSYDLHNGTIITKEGDTISILVHDNDHNDGKYPTNTTTPNRKMQIEGRELFQQPHPRRPQPLDEVISYDLHSGKIITATTIIPDSSSTRSTSIISTPPVSRHHMETLLFDNQEYHTAMFSSTPSLSPIPMIKNGQTVIEEGHSTTFVIDIDNDFDDVISNIFDSYDDEE